ncbi:MAG: GNAT family N-acetyltransferase, partial [Sphingomonadales bacterium]|nr:GNAT family N-acetyltransferase [Sphingomonadales bacterium]
MSTQTHLPTQENAIARSKGLTLVTPLNTQAMSPEEIELWWQIAQTQEYMFTDFERGNREGWIARFLDMRHLHFDIGGDGYCIVLNAWCCDSPEVHFCIWNAQRPQQTLKASEQVLNFVFGEMGAQRIGTFIPDTNKPSIKLATLLGFKFEGCIRSAYLYFGKRYDMH